MQPITFTDDQGVFNGTFTVESPTGEHRTLRIKTQKDDAKFAPGARIVALLTGPDNENSYRGLGFVNGASFKLWRKQDTPTHQGIVKALFALLIHGPESALYAKGYRLHAATSCIRCNRKLTTPESVTSGIGPVCAGRE